MLQSLRYPVTLRVLREADGRYPVVAVSREEIELAFHFVNSGAPMEHHAHISLDTGYIHWVSEFNMVDEEVPDDLETSDRYIALPHKNELGLGRNLALDFAADALPDRYKDVEAIFRRKGAYRRFKDLPETEGLLDKWYEFEDAAMNKALREWCAANDIAIVETRGEPSR
jgi:hypothetical protein